MVRSLLVLVPETLGYVGFSRTQGTVDEASGRYFPLCQLSQESVVEDRRRCLQF